MKSVGAVQDEKAKGSAPEPELSATLPPPRFSEEGGGAAAAAGATTTANRAALPAQPRGSSGLPKARGVLRTLEACAAGLEGTAAVAGISVSLSPPGRLLLPELIGRALGGHLRMEVALGSRALEALSSSRSSSSLSKEEEEEEQEKSEKDDKVDPPPPPPPPWWLSSSPKQQPPARAAFPFCLSVKAARGSVAVRGWRVPTGLTLERPVAVEASLGDDLARALLARVHPFLASAVSVSAAGEGGGEGGGARARERPAPRSSSPSPPAAAVIPSPLSCIPPLPPPVRASLWPSGGHLPAESLDVVVQPLSLSLAPTGPVSSLIAALGLGVVSLSSAVTSGGGAGAGGARLRTGKLRATVYRGGRVRAKRLDVEIAAVAKRRKKKKWTEKKTSGNGGGGDGYGEGATKLPPRPTSAFDAAAAAADPLAAAQAWFTSVLSGGEGSGVGVGDGCGDKGKSGGGGRGGDENGGGGGGGGDDSDSGGEPAPIRLALWGSADAGANDALDARVGIPVGALRGGGGVKRRRRKRKSKEKRARRSGGDDGEIEGFDSPSSSDDDEEEDEDVVALRIVGPASNPAIDWASAARELPAAAAAAAGERVRAAAAAAVATAAASRLGSAVGAPSWLTDAASAALLRQRRPSSVGGGGGAGGEKDRADAGNNKSASPATRSLLSPFSSSSLFSSAAPSPSLPVAPPRDEPFDWEVGEVEKSSSSSPLRGRRLRFGG